MGRAVPVKESRAARVAGALQMTQVTELNFSTKSADAGEALNGASYRKNIAWVYSSFAIGALIVSGTCMIVDKGVDAFILMPVVLAAYTLALIRRWIREPSFIFGRKDITWHVLALALAVSAWTLVFAYRHLHDDMQLYLAFSFVAFTTISTCAALIYLPRAMNTLLFIGLTTCFAIALMASWKFTVLHAVMAAVAIGAIRNLLVEHRRALFAARKAHEGAMIANNRLKGEQAITEDLAYTDRLTGLGNRLAFLETLQARIESSGESHRFALLLFDLNGFKQINDRGGHAAGDAALNEIAVRLRDLMQPGESCGRLGGDEFAAVLNLGDDFAERRRRIGSRLNGAFVHAGIEYVLSAACGYAEFPKSGGDRRELMRNADYASYKAKSGKLHETGHLYSDVDRREQEVNLLARHAVVDSVERGVIETVFQPIVAEYDMPRIGYGVEALSRWPVIEGSPLIPQRAFLIAEELGITTNLTWILLRAAVEQRNEHLAGAVLFFNFSRGQFRNADIWSALPDWIAATGISAESLVIEISEEVVLEDIAASGAILNLARSIGIRFALDDFGTGNTGLALLTEFRFEFVKLDKAFFSRCRIDPAANIIVRKLCEMCAGIGAQVIVEGIENETDYELARKLGATHFQGYHFAVPAGAAEIAHLIDESAVTELRRYA